MVCNFRIGDKVVLTKEALENRPDLAKVVFTIAKDVTGDSQYFDEGAGCALYEVTVNLTEFGDCFYDVELEDAD